MTTQTLPAFFLVAVALGGAACSDTDSTTAPATAETAITTAAPAAKEPRTPYISGLTLHSIYLDIAPDGTYDNGFDMVFTNPGAKTDGLYFQVDIKQGPYTEDGGGNALYCQAQAGVMGHGTCRMTWWVGHAPLYFALGPATLTVRLMQNRNDQGAILLDSRTVDVIIVHS
jgi:hypothetical protein